MDNSILDQQELYNPQLSKSIQELRHNYQEKLWHQLSEALLKYSDDPVLAEGSNLLDLYEGFIKDFETKIDQIKLMKLIIKITDQLPNPEKGIEFLEHLKSTTLKDEQAILLSTLKQGVFRLRQNNFDATKTIIGDAEKKIERINNVDSFVYSFFHKLCALYYQARNNFESFYKHSLQYLAYTPETSMKKEEKEQISLEMGLAVLISKNIYNFSELLEQPVLKALEATHQTIYALIKIFNNGDVDSLNKILNDSSNPLSAYAGLQGKNQKNLLEKIRIMAFLDLIFSLPKNDRQVSFQLIADRTRVSVNEVELLVMRSMSLELVKGSIDQIEKTVKITWIMPRVLDKERIGIMKDKLELWNKSLGSLLQSLEGYELV